MQPEIQVRLEAEGIPVMTMDHGYVKSIYVVDPDGLNIEFTVDAPNYPEICEYEHKRARVELEKWMAGDHTPNHNVRPY